MSFGVGITDFVTLSGLAWKAYKACKDAPEGFLELHQELQSFHAVIKQTEEIIDEEVLSPTQQARLETIGDGCRCVLTDVQAQVDRYEKLRTKAKRSWVRNGWASQEIPPLRNRLVSHMTMLTGFMSTSQVFVRGKLNQSLRDWQAGDHEGSVLSTHTVESLTTDEKEAWRSIRHDLSEIGISAAAFDINKDFILQWFRDALESGALEELAPSDAWSTHSFGQISDVDIGISDDDNEAVREVNLDTLPRRVLTASFTPNVRDGDSSIEKKSAFSSHPVGSNPELQEAPTRKPIRKPPPLLGRFRSLVGRDGSRLNRAAADGDNVELLRMLKNGVDLNISSGMPLHTAIERGNIQTAQLLIQHGASLNHTWHSGTLEKALEFHVTAFSPDGTRGVENPNGPEVVTLLLEAGADIRVCGVVTALEKLADTWSFARPDLSSKCADLLLQYGADVNSKSRYSGESPLHRAARFGLRDYVCLLLERGADVNAGTRRYQSTPLHFAVASREFYRFPSDFDSLARTSLHEPALTEYQNQTRQEIVRVLLNHGADYDVRTSTGRTPLHFAVKHMRKAEARLLLDAGAKVDAVDRNGESALDIAARAESDGMVALLLDRGALAGFNHRKISYWDELRTHMEQVKLEGGQRSNEGRSIGQA